MSDFSFWTVKKSLSKLNDSEVRALPMHVCLTNNAAKTHTEVSSSQLVTESFKSDAGALHIVRIPAEALE